LESLATGHWRLATVLLTLAACDLPTKSPKVDQAWAIPVAQDRIAVTDLLPASIQVVDGAFRVPLHSGTATALLRDVCGTACSISQVPLPKPAFSTTLPLALKRPTDFARVTLAGGDTIVVKLTQALGFPLLAPPGATAPGSIHITLALGSDTVRVRINGASEPWPSGSTLEIPFPLEAGATLSSDVSVLVEIDSPAGDPVKIDGDARLAASVAVGAEGTGTVGITSVTALVRDDVSVSSESVTLDLTGIDPDISAKARSAVLTFIITNPLDAIGHFTATFTAGDREVLPPEQITIPPGRSTTQLTLSRTELDALLRERITIGLTGTVEAASSSGLVTIRPMDALTVDTRITLGVVVPWGG
jgi:hypothetical protein